MSLAHFQEEKSELYSHDEIKLIVVLKLVLYVCAPVYEDPLQTGVD